MTKTMGWLCLMLFAAALCAAPARADAPRRAAGGSPAAIEVPAPRGQWNIVAASGGSSSDRSESPVQIGAGAWFTSLSGSVGASGFNGNLKGTLGISDSTSPLVDLEGHIGIHTIGLGFSTLSGSGTRQLNQQVVINNTTYKVSDVVTSKLDYSSLDLYWKPRLLGRPDTNLSALVVIKIISLDANVNDQTQNVSQKVSLTAPLPMIGLSADYAFNPQIRAYGQFGWISGGFGGGSVSSLDYRLGLKFYPIQNLDISADYRDFNITGRDSKNNHADVEYGGPALELHYHF